MEYIVTVKVGGAPGEESSKIVWPSMVVEAEDRWEALVKAVKHLGIEKTFPMRYLWKKASIVKKERKGTREFRVESDLSKIDSLEVIR